jgi:hypothetical protein
MLRAKTYLMSLGFLSQHLQRSPASIEAALDALGIAPEVNQNGIGYYSEDAFCQLADKYEWHPEVRGNG